MFQGKPPAKMAIFCPKWPKNAKFGPKTVFFGLRWSVQGPPHPILQVFDSQQHVLQGMGARKWVFQGRLPKKWSFSPKMA